VEELRLFLDDNIDNIPCQSAQPILDDNAQGLDFSCLSLFSSQAPTTATGDSLHTFPDGLDGHSERPQPFSGRLLQTAKSNSFHASLPLSSTLLQHDVAQHGVPTNSSILSSSSATSYINMCSHFQSNELHSSHKDSHSSSLSPRYHPYANLPGAQHMQVRIAIGPVYTTLFDILL
jgi:hypothetical protein